ncbi:hypothetical protein GCM10009836_32350 [Pseudonocardia ailaonensis]|uniref:Modulator of FtsH protease n=1 Tax=Pseudonocardia ailaonensis TaxID=367279 RepID=A0ABN2N328_9PSEU
MADWANFAVAVTGAGAALIGLLVVALSINLGQIVRSAELPGRAVLALLLLVVPLIAALLLLVPQTGVAYGVELLVAGVLLGGWIGWLVRPSSRSPEQPRAAWLAGTAGPAVLVVLTTLTGGALLAAGNPAGFYALPVLVLGGFAGALIGTWVLLVEILR